MATTQEQPANGLSSIPLPEIPVKLRCTICSELARGASRLPCCEQSICESCHTNLPNVCPVCDHSPLSPDDCKANTALRTTVAVFLRTAEKKHNLLQQKEQKEKAKPIDPKAEVKNAELEPDKIVPVHVSPVQNPLTPPQEVDDSTRAEGQQALPQVPQENTEVVVEQIPAKSHDATPTPSVEQTNGFVDQQNSWFNQQNPNGMGNMQQMQQMFPGHDFSGPNGWNVYNQVLQEIQGGWMNGYGNMMEYPMNSVTQGGGFGGGSFGNMGVNGAGGCHNGHDGMGWNSGWENNVGFNPGMEGTRNGGYYSAASAGGYNHQSHGNLQMPTQQYQNHHFLRQQPYPRGGRGGFVGGARQYSHERQQQQAFQDSQFSQQLQGIDEAVAAVVGSSGDEKKGEKIPSIVSGDPENIADPNDVPIDTSSTVLAGADPVIEDLADSLNPAAPVNPDMAQYFPPDDFRGPGYQSQFYPPRGGFRGNFRAGYRGDFGMGMRGGTHNIAPIPSVLGDAECDKMPGIGLGVEGAPTGPKALREGVPSVRGAPTRGGAFGRGRGVYAGSSWTRSISPGRARSRSRRRSSATGRDRSRDPSRDRHRKSRSRNRESRHRKQHSPSVGSDGEPRGRTPKREGEEPISPAQDKELIEIVIGEPNNTDIAQLASAVRSKRSREDSDSRERARSASKSRSRSADRHHKRSRRDRERRLRTVTESRDREGRDKEGRDKEGRDKEGRDKEAKDKESRDNDGSSRHHRRSHKHKSSRRHRSRSRSKSPKKEDYLVEDKSTVRDVDGVDGKSRRNSRERERRHKRRSKREESRHRSHRHKSSRHDRHDRHDKDDKYDKDDKHDKDDKYDRRDDRKDGRKDKHEKGESDAIVEKKVESHRPAEKDLDRKSIRDSRSRRKPSYKYEDEEDLERRAERDREAERWGGVKK